MKSNNHAIGNSYFRKHNIKRNNWELILGWGLVVLFTGIAVYATIYAATCRLLLWW